MKSYLKYVALLTILGICLGLAAFIRQKQQQADTDGTIYEFTIAKKGTMIDNATCYAWIPNNVGTIRSVIVHLHGCTREGDAKQK